MLHGRRPFRVFSLELIRSLLSRVYKRGYGRIWSKRFSCQHYESRKRLAALLAVDWLNFLVKHVVIAATVRWVVLFMVVMQ
jgi:hypothetical protein